jgi:hypothetical protein
MITPTKLGEFDKIAKMRRGLQPERPSRARQLLMEKLGTIHDDPHQLPAAPVDPSLFPR